MAITTSPLYPVVDEAITVVSSTATGDIQVLAITSVPSSSSYDTGLVLTDNASDAPTAPLMAAELERYASTVTLDEPGEYGVTAYDIMRLPALIGTDNGGAEARYVLNRSDTGIIHVGAIVDLPIRTIDGRGADLRLQVNDTTIRAASLVNHSDDNARAVADVAAVTAALAALVGQTAGTIGNDLVAGTTDLLGSYEAHRVLVAGAVHAAADGTNVAARTDPDSVNGAIDVLNQLRSVMVDHLEDTPAAAPWHTNEDRKNLPLAAPAFDVASGTVLLADLRERVFERHRVQIAAPVVHGAADAANPLTAVTLLDTAIISYLDALITTSPAVLAGEPEGAHDLAANFGFAIQDSD